VESFLHCAKDSNAHAHLDAVLSLSSKHFIIAFEKDQLRVIKNSRTVRERKEEEEDKKM
jgi:hypothetical protein